MEALPTKVLRPRRLKTLALFVVSAAFVIGGAVLVREGNGWGWIATCFFGLCALVFAVQLLPGSAYLRIGPEGFTICYLFRAQTIPWRVVNSFEVGHIAGNRAPMTKGVVFDYDAPDYEEYEMLRQLASSTASHEGALSDTYGMDPQELADLLNNYRRRYAGHQPAGRH